MFRIDIGCGDSKRVGFVGVDVRKTKAVDVIADARKLPFRDSCFNYVYSSHLIEHFSHREVKNVLVEWVRVLRKGELSKSDALTFVQEVFYSF